MAARRERERRRTTDRRYSFAPSDDAAPAPEETLIDGAPDEAEVLEPELAEAPTVSAEPVGQTTTARRSAAAPRAARASATRPEPRPFSAYRDEYRYVIDDLRRVVVVIGSLLVLLIVLAFLLPH